MQPFFHEKRWNPQTVVSNDPLLNRVGLFGRGIKIVDAANSKCFPKLLGIPGQESRIMRRVRLIEMLFDKRRSPRIKVKLADFFFESHAAKKIFDAFFDREI
jgi:hypothetical protein